MSEPSLLTSRKNPLVLGLKSQDLTNPRLPLKKVIQNLLNPAAPSLLLSPFLQGTRGKEMMSTIPAPPSPLKWLPKKPHRRKRMPLILTTVLALLARKFLCLCFLFVLFFGILIFVYSQF